MQNRDYNHTSQEEMLEKVGTLKLGNHRYCYQPKPGEILPVGTGVFNDSESGAIHLTPHGYCIHDYVIPLAGNYLKPPIMDG